MIFDYNVTDLKVISSIIMVVFGYYLYYFTAFSKKAAQYFQKKQSGDELKMKMFSYQKINGFIFLGLLPGIIFYLLFKTLNFGFLLPRQVLPQALLMILALTALIILLMFFSARNSEVYDKSPQMRISRWGKSTLMVSLLGWAIYLFAYEFLFRGIFLFTWVEAYGIWPAIAVNLAVYSAFHLPNGISETLGALVFGLIMCMFSIYTNSFLPAFILHFALAASNEVLSVHYNPQMNFDFNTNKAALK